MVNVLEMELISKLYGYMSEVEIQDWTLENAEDMYTDEIKISNEWGIDCPIESAEVLYETIKEFIEQDLG